MIWFLIIFNLWVGYVYLKTGNDYWSKQALIAIKEGFSNKTAESINSNWTGIYNYLASDKNLSFGGLMFDAGIFFLSTYFLSIIIKFVLEEG